MRIPKKRMFLTFFILLSFVFFNSAFGQKPTLKLKTRFISPAGGETWNPAFKNTIRWASGSPIDSTWTLILFKANPTKRIGLIRENIPKSVTSHEWKPGETTNGKTSTGSDFFIRLKFTRNGKIQKVDSKKFNIKKFVYDRARIIVTVPKKKTEWWNGKDVVIKWTTKFLDIKTKMHIALWDGKGENAILGIGFGSNGSFSWKVPIDLIPQGVYSRQYKIKVKTVELLSKGGDKGQKKPTFGMSETFNIYFQEPPR